MTFLAPERLWLFAVLLVLAAAYVVLRRRRRREAVTFPNALLLSSVMKRRFAWRRHVPAAAAVLALAAGIVGIARPATAEQVPRAGEVMLAIDISGSMAATDVTPTRLKAAVTAATGFVHDAPPNLRIGLVVFSDRATVLATPTTDRAAVTGALATLRPGPGTAAGEGLYAALHALGPTKTTGSKPAAAVVLLADGASTVGRSLADAAQAAKQQGVPVDTVAFGTSHGTVRLGGQTVAVPVETTALHQVATTTGGKFEAAASSQQLRSVYEEVGHGVGFETRYTEFVHLLTGVAVALLLVASALALLWMPRLA